MFLEFRKNEIDNNFETIYNALKTNDTRLLATAQPVRTDKDVAFASYIVNDGRFFCWRHYGASAERQTKSALKFLLNNIFDDCNYFTLIDNEQYNARVDAYYATK